MSLPISSLFGLRRSATIVAAIIVALFASRVCIASHGHAESEPAEAEAGEHSSSEISGIELGEFKIRSDYPVEAQKSTVRFVLYAQFKGEQSPDMKRLVEEHRQKLRDIIITTTRLAPLAVFEEADLATFRRRILIRLRRTFPELAVENLYISDFSLLVKSL